MSGDQEAFASVRDFHELEHYQQDLDQLLARLQRDITNQIHYSKAKCTQLQDEEAFVRCHKKLEKALQAQMKHLEFGIIHWKYQTVKCFAHESQHEKRFEECRARQNQELTNIFGQFNL